MDDAKFESSDQSQMRAAGKVYGNVYFGDTYQSNGPREITVSDVGGTPPNFDRYWVDRTSYQTELRDCILTRSVTEIVAIGGFGKSSLAAWGYANLRGGFQKRLWVSFGQPKTFDRVARWILQEVGFPNKDPEVKNDGLLRELLYRLNDPNTPVKTLVVLDQLETVVEASDRQWFERFLMQWAENGQESRVLVTTRSPFLSQEPIALGGLNQAEGATFLGREGLTGDRFSALVDLTKGHPLLLKLAASWTKETYDSQVDDRAIDFFTKLFANYKGDPRDGVAAIFDVIFGALPIALQTLLCGLSVYRLPIDEAMAIAMVAEATIWDLEELAGRGLLLAQGDRFVLHPLVAGLVRLRVTEEVRRDGHERAIGFYEANYQDWDGTIESCRSEFEGFYHACELGEYQRAIRILDRCHEMLDRAGESRSLLPLYKRLTCEWDAANETEANDLNWAWARFGGIHKELSSFELAIAAYQKALETSQLRGDSNCEGGILCNLGHVYSSLGQYRKAIDFYEKALPLQKEVRNREFEANSLGGLGSAYHSLGDYDKAIEFHSQSLEIAQEINDRNGEGGILCNLGHVYLSLVKYEKAITFYQRALIIQKETGNRVFEAKTLNSLGSAHSCLGDYAKAIDFHSQALEIVKEIGSRSGEGAALCNLGNAYSDFQDYKQSIKFYQLALPIQREVGDCRFESNSLSGLGHTYHSLGEYQEAIDFYQQSLKIRQEIGNRKGEANSYWGLNNSYQQLGRPKLSMHYRHQAYRIWQDMNLPLAAAPFPAWTKKLIQSMGDTWAEQLVATDKAMAWLMLPIGYLLFTLRILISPLTQLQTRLKIQPKIFWFCVGIVMVFAIAWLKR